MEFSWWFCRNNIECVRDSWTVICPSPYALHKKRFWWFLSFEQKAVQKQWTSIIHKTYYSQWTAIPHNHTIYHSHHYQQKLIKTNKIEWKCYLEQVGKAYNADQALPIKSRVNSPPALLPAKIKKNACDIYVKTIAFLWHLLRRKGVRQQKVYDNESCGRELSYTTKL